MASQILNQFIMAQVLYDLRNGQLRRALALGFTEQDLRLLNDPEKVSALFNAPVLWVNARVDSKLLQRLIEQARKSQEEMGQVDQMLILGASSKMIAQVFGLNHREIAFRKRLLTIQKKQGRWPEITEEQNHQLWREWKAQIAQEQLDPENAMEMAKVCMRLSQTHQIPMAMIWQSIEDWLEIDLSG